MVSRILFLAAVLALNACGGGNQASTALAPTPNAQPTHTAWVPVPGAGYEWQLSGTLDTTVVAPVYDIDGFGTTSAQVASLHAAGRNAVCYIDAGTFETGRPDAAAFPTSVIGNPDAGWPGEFWLDIRQLATLGPIMTARFQMCASKGFDAIEADNVDGFDNPTGFAIGAPDQLTYNTFLAQQAHLLGLSIALKNDPTQATTLAPIFDFALAEDCYVQGWCMQLTPFLTEHKAVIAVEYTDLTTSATFTTVDCPAAHTAGITTILKDRALDAWIETCP